MDGATVAPEEELAVSRGRRIFIQRYRRGDRMEFSTPDTVIRAGDVVTATASRADFISGVARPRSVRRSTTPQSLGYDIESLPIVVTKGGMTLTELPKSDDARNLFIKRIVRGPTSSALLV